MPKGILRKPWVCGKCGQTFKNGGGHTVVCGTGESERRYWLKVDKSGGPDACWPWKASTFKKKNKQMGYGRNAGSGPYTYAHRCAWLFTFGEIPDGKLVMHKCDNVLCCNPKHLSIGTDLDNNRDMRAKGRWRHRYLPVEKLLHPELSRRRDE